MSVEKGKLVSSAQPIKTLAQMLQSGDIEGIKKSITREQLEQPVDDVRPPLVYAAIHAKVNLAIILKHLLDMGADVYAKGEGKETAFQAVQNRFSNAEREKNALEKARFRGAFPYLEVAQFQADLAKLFKQFDNLDDLGGLKALSEQLKTLQRSASAPIYAGARREEMESVVENIDILLDSVQKKIKIQEATKQQEPVKPPKPQSTAPVTTTTTTTTTEVQQPPVPPVAIVRETAFVYLPNNSSSAPPVLTNFFAQQGAPGSVVLGVVPAVTEKPEKKSSETVSTPQVQTLSQSSSS